MISGITGTLVKTSPNALHVSVGGVTFQIFAPITTIANISEKVSSEISLETYLYVREDTLSLYGFLTLSDRLLFEQLLSISGVGPKVALAILSTFDAEVFAQIIENEDVHKLTLVPGLGKKTAARLVLELKGKLVKNALESGVSAASLDQELVDALTSLGYSQGLAESAVSKMEDKNGTIEEQIVRALQYLVKD